MTVDVAKISTRFLVKFEPPEVQVSKACARFAVQLDPGTNEKVVSKVSARFARRLPPHRDQRLTKASTRFLLHMSPNFRWIDMFKDIVFPHNISEGSDGATRFNTQVNEVASGHDQRISLWNYPLMEYNIAYGVRTMEQLHDLIRFFRAVKGKLYSFRFLDQVDHTSTLATQEEARKAPDPSAFDQLLGTGDDSRTTWQLVKHYDYAGEPATRPIYKPIEGTVLVGVNGQQVTWFTCNYSTGEVTINNRYTDLALTGLKLEAENLGAHIWKITVPNYVPDNPATPLVNEQVDQLLPVLFEDERFSLVGGDIEFYNVRVLTSTTTELRFTWLDGLVGDATDDLDAALSTNNVPEDGFEVTAGYQFHVPVRFDTDRLPVRLDYYGVGAANEITLVEVRPDEE